MLMNCSGQRPGAWTGPTWFSGGSQGSRALPVPEFVRPHVVQLHVWWSGLSRSCKML